MKFKKDVLQDILEGYTDDGEVIEDTLVGHSRWSLEYRLVFTDNEGRFYSTVYRRGATEIQEEAPWEYEGDEIDCVEVFPVEKTLVVYE